MLNRHRNYLVGALAISLAAACSRGVWAQSSRTAPGAAQASRPAASEFTTSRELPEREWLVTGAMRPAFDHLGNIGEQLDGAVAARCTIVYATGVGAFSYCGLPPKAVLEAHLAKLNDYNRRAYTGGVRIVLSYLCATSIVKLETFAANWNDYFPGRAADFDPRRMLQQDIKGNNLPSWYGGDYAPADMWNPSWREYTKYTIKLAVESGHDGVFFDNPTVHPAGNYSPHAMRAWAQFAGRHGVHVAANDIAAARALTVSHPELWRRFRVTEAADFLREMRDYGRSLKPEFVLTANNSLNSWDSFYSQPQHYAYSIPEQSRHEDFITIEDMSSQPRRQGDAYVSYSGTLRLLHAIGNGRPLAICTTDGDYIGPPSLMGLSIAECTAHDAAYMAWTCWEPAYREPFAAGLARYHDFLDAHPDLFGHTRPVSDVLLVWPYDNWVRRSDCASARLARELSARNIQYDVVAEAALRTDTLKAYRAVAFAAEEGLALRGTAEMLRAYERQGGAVVPVGGDIDVRPLQKAISPPPLELDARPGVRGVARSTEGGGLLLHLYNLNVTRVDSYHDSVTPVENLRVWWLLPRGQAGVARVRLLTPDEAGSSGWRECTASAALDGRSRLAFVVPRLWIWTVVALP